MTSANTSRASGATIAEAVRAFTEIAAATPPPQEPEPCDPVAMKDAPPWAVHVCGELRILRAEVSALRRRVAGAAFVGFALVELARLAIEHFS